MNRHSAREMAITAVPELVLLDECGEVNPEFPYGACTLSYGHNGAHEHISSGYGSPKGVVRWGGDRNLCPACQFGDRRVPHTTPLGHQCSHTPEPSTAEARLLADD